MNKATLMNHVCMSQVLNVTNVAAPLPKDRTCKTGIVRNYLSFVGLFCGSLAQLLWVSLRTVGFLWNRHS